MLKDYDWPGNLHELKSIINTIYNRSKGQIIKLSDFESLVDAEQHPVLV
jgi:transcriptional regulator of acetoin/glycerol metabolism